MAEGSEAAALVVHGADAVVAVAAWVVAEVVGEEAVAAADSADVAEVEAEVTAVLARGTKVPVGHEPARARCAFRT